MARFIRFPGAVGAYVSTPVVNLLDADTSHMFQSIGLWQFAVQVAEPLAYSGFSASRTLSASLNDIRTPNDATSPAVSANTQYTVSLVFEADVASGQELIFRIISRDSGGGNLSQDDVLFDSDGPGVPTMLQQTITTPELTTALQIGVQGNHAEVTSTFAVWDVSIQEGTGSTFVPSMDIVGTLFEAKNPPDIPAVFTAGQDYRIGESFAGDGFTVTRHDGADASAPLVASFDAGDVGI